MSIVIPGYILLNYSVNFVSSVLLILVSKHLFRQYPISSITITIYNCFITGLLASVILRFLPEKSTNSPSKVNRLNSFIRQLFISICFTLFLIFSNLSLQYNSIGTYQLIKLQVPPTIMFIELVQLNLGFYSASLTYEKFRRDYSLSVICAFSMITLATLISTYSNLNLHPLGILFAFVSVLFNALYQIFVQNAQITTISERLTFTRDQMFTSSLILIPFWPFVDSSFQFNWFLLTQTDINIFLLFNGILAFAVNTSIIWCIQDDTAVRYNIIGQMKTLIIIFLGSVLFREIITIKQSLCALFTTAGCILYVYVTYQNKHSQRKSTANLHNEI